MYKLQYSLSICIYNIKYITLSLHKYKTNNLFSGVATIYGAKVRKIIFKKFYDITY